MSRRLAVSAFEWVPCGGSDGPARSCSLIGVFTV